MQQFNSFSLEEAAQPLDSFPDPRWVGMEGPQGKDRIPPKLHLTMYVKGGLWIRMKVIPESGCD
jgi:hypothetical protein